MNITKVLLHNLSTTRDGFERMERRIVDLLERDPRADEQAILRIYDRQTRDEKASSTTNHLNGIGFQACDARRGSYYGKLIARGNHLFPYHLNVARKMAIKYRTQLTVLAFEKVLKAVRAHDPEGLVSEDRS